MSILKKLQGNDKINMKEVREMKLESCPCCGEAMVSSFEECPVCGWCNDYANTAYPDARDLENNQMSLNEARAAWKKKRKKIA
jgi:hypothetical protein